MDNLIARHHLCMNKETFVKQKKSGTFNGFYGSLDYVETVATTDKFKYLLKKVGEDWDWDNKDVYKNDLSISSKLSQPKIKLLYLLNNMRTIGYSLIVEPSDETLEQFSDIFKQTSSVIEIENLGLFPDQAGNGKGIKFFEMIMADLFKTHDYVYWSMSSTNHPHLFDFYTKRMGMQHIGTDFVPNFSRNIDGQKQVA